MGTCLLLRLLRGFAPPDALNGLGGGFSLVRLVENLADFREDCGEHLGVDALGLAGVLDDLDTRIFAIVGLPASEDFGKIFDEADKAEKPSKPFQGIGWREAPKKK